MKRTTYILIGMYFLGLIMTVVGTVTLVNKLEKYHEPQYEMTAPVQSQDTDNDES